MRRRQNGISVTEIVFSLVVLTLLVILVMNLLPASLLSVRYGEHQQQAQDVAQSTLTEFLAKDYEELIPGTYELEDSRVGTMSYQRSVDILLDPETDDMARGIKVTVRFQSGRVARTVVREAWRADVTR